MCRSPWLGTDGSEKFGLTYDRESFCSAEFLFSQALFASFLGGWLRMHTKGNSTEQALSPRVLVHMETSGVFLDF